MSIEKKYFEWNYHYITLGDALLYACPSHNIKEPTCRLPFLYAFNPSTSHLAVNPSSSNLAIISSTSQLEHSSLTPLGILPQSTLISHLSRPNLFNDFFHSWAQNSDKPSLQKPPPPFHLTPPISPAQPLSDKPIYCQLNQPSYPKTNRKITSHTHSKFRPYALTRPRTAALSSSLHSPSQLPFPTNPVPQTSPSTNTIPALSLFPHSPSQLPFTTNQTPQTSALPYTVPAILSKGKGKSKLILGDDVVPLTQLKKSRCRQKVFVNSLSDLETTILSLIKLQDASLVKGLVHKFLTSPLLGTLGQNLEGMPLPGYPFAPNVYEDQKVFQCRSSPIRLLRQYSRF